MAAETLNQLWSRAIVEELVRSGVRHAVVCPGSRSTPIALALAAQDGLRTWSIVDERSAAFFALGLARASGVPAVVLATSGSAGAHFLPALIEAAMAQVPLIAITADRPPELQGWGAPQTIPQARLFGAFAREFFELGVPEASSASLLHLRASVCRAVAITTRAPRGPVHLNAPFREPLAPPANPDPLPDLPERAVLGEGSQPLVRLGAPQRAVDPVLLADVRAALEQSQRGLIVVGPRDASDGLAEAVIALGRAWGHPVLAEATSNVRFGHADDVVSTADALLRHGPFATAHRPEVVLRFGGGLTPKVPTQWLDASGARLFVFSDGGALIDPCHAAAAILEGDPVAAARALTPSNQRRQTAFAASFRAADQRVRAALSSAFTRDEALTEPRIAHEVARALPAGANLFVSSSMPIRDLDAFAYAGGAVRVFANRGANGIDGITSTALGVAAASGRPTTLLTGDLAFLHDLGGLMAGKRHRLRLSIVVVNNDGGGIFSFLPVAGRSGRFEELFGTPHGLDLAQAAKLFDARYVRCEDAARLRASLAEGAEAGLQVIEVRTERTQNVRVHQALFAELATALGEGPWA